MAHQLAILCPIVGVAAEELLCEPGKVESAWSRGALFPLLHPRPLSRVGNELGRGTDVLPCHVLGSRLPRNGEAPPAGAGGGGDDQSRRAGRVQVRLKSPSSPSHSCA